MNAGAEIFIPLLMASLILFSPLVQAAADDKQIVFSPSINIDIDGLIKAVKSSASELGSAVTGNASGIGETINGSITGMPVKLFGLFKDSMRDSAKSFNDPFLGLAESLMKANPDPDSLYTWWQYITALISSFYLFIFLFAGLMFLLSFSGAEKRAVAKEWLRNAFMIIIGVNVSFVLYRLVLETAEAATGYIFAEASRSILASAVLSGAGIMLLAVYAFGLLCLSITLFARYVFLLVGVMLFPVGIFLYFIPPLREWGKAVFNLLGAALFMQFIDAILFVASTKAASDFAGGQGGAYLPAVGLILIACVNAALIFYALIKAAFSATQGSAISFAFGALAGHISSLVESTQTRAGK